MLKIILIVVVTLVWLIILLQLFVKTEIGGLGSNMGRITGIFVNKTHLPDKLGTVVFIAIILSIIALPGFLIFYFF